MPTGPSRLESRLRRLERQVALLTAWVVEDRNVAVLGLLSADISRRAILEGREGFAEAECSASESLRRIEEQFARNVKARVGEDVDLARPERVPTSVAVTQASTARGRGRRA